MLPKMSTCMACHQAKNVKDGTDCATCHTNAGIGSERPANHTPLWATTHGRGLSKKTIDQSCNLCHTAASGNDCASCHQREAPANHNRAWSLGSHGIAAKTNRNNCTVCHSEDQCITCHTTEQPATHTASWGSPLDKHCYTCHFQDLATSGYGSSKIGSNCGVCHMGASVLAKHREAPRLATRAGGTANLANCSTCHTPFSRGSLRIPHPFPSLNATTVNSAQCLACHI
jgi:hypothetical protein